MKLLTSLARAVLVAISMLLFVLLGISLVVDISNRTTSVASWPPSGLFLRSLMLVICLPIHTVAAVRYRQHVFPLYAVFSTLAASVALMGTDAGTFFGPMASTAALALYWGSRWRQP